MARVLGVGGIFFKAADPEQLGQWYTKHLGISIDSSYGGASFYPNDQPPKAYTVWAPFQQNTTYFDPSERPYMFNLIVDNLPDALAQVAQGGAQLIGEPDDNEFGLFGWFMDPEGNKVELWQPK